MTTYTTIQSTPKKELTQHELRKTRAGQQKLRELGHSPQGHKKRMWAQDRPFVAWDGEGVTNGDGSHHYILFGASTGDSVSAPSLSTTQCLDVLLRTEIQTPHALHVGFAIVYDIDMLLRDLPDATMDRLIRENTAWWKNYRLEYIRGKYFQVSRDIRGKRVCIRIWDIFSFFRTSFINVISKYLTLADEMLQKIKEGKDSRKQFVYSELEEHIRPYWKLELECTVNLMERFRELMIEAGFNISQWGGPGYVASHIFKIHKIKNHIERDLPKEVLDASQYAFQAGRFRAATCRKGRLQNLQGRYKLGSPRRYHKVTIAQGKRMETRH